MTKLLEYPLFRSKRKTIAIIIDKTGRVKVRAPKKASIEKINQFVYSKIRWIENSIKKIEKRKPEPSSQNQYLFGQKLENKLSGEELKNLYLTEIKNYCDKRLIDLKKQMSLDKVEIDLGFRLYKSKWGSCKSIKQHFFKKRYKIMFNLKLAAFRKEIVDYVIIHEMCHIFEMNHSSRFWDKVKLFCPEFKELRKWLRKDSQAYLFEDLS